MFEVVKRDFGLRFDSSVEYIWELNDPVVDGFYGKSRAKIPDQSEKIKDEFRLIEPDDEVFHCTSEIGTIVTNWRKVVVQLVFEMTLQSGRLLQEPVDDRNSEALAIFLGEYHG